MNKNNQMGRSMVEMLGVLAIIGVLSVGGIAGYSKAMEKFKLQKGLDQIQTILVNVMNLDENQFIDEDTTAIRAGIVPVEMLNGKTSSTATEIYNVFGMPVYINHSYVRYEIPSISSCVYYATQNWIGFDIGIGGYSDYMFNQEEIPIPLSRAQQICKQQIQEDDGGGYLEFYFPR